MPDLSAFSLEGKRILVTGASRGIGQGIAVAIARAGGEVIGASRTSMDETAALVAAEGGHFAALFCDMADTQAAQAMLEEVWERHGPIDGLVNNAGIGRRKPALEMTVEDWDRVLDVNLKTLFFLCQALARKALGQGRGARIINIASMLSYQGGIHVAPYTAAKHGVVGVTRILANEWAAQGINVNAIAPGYIDTAITQAIRKDPARDAAVLGRIPAGRWGVPADLGETAVFLLSPASAYIHGTVIPVDGGWLAR